MRGGKRYNNFKWKIFFSADYNYSYNDFLASVSPQVEIEDMGNGSKKITFDQGDGDIGDTNRVNTDYQKIFTKEEQPENPKGQVSETKAEVNTSHIRLFPLGCCTERSCSLETCI
ncbi:unnamed protein product [Parnassius apollo]|uniref:(apollo) hypothetical protein n=1 Tax=Parnassius apollo TaxID=110799 RepID=A0A8S3Y8H2_PARAO|nr:unnamed protein product [Parnassius apollo]